MSNTPAMVNTQSPERYDSPQVTEYGSIEAVTEQSNKLGNETDSFSDTTPLIGSIEPAS